MEIQADLIKQFREQQQKYAYYIIALSVAGIGFAIQKTLGLPLSYTQIPLGFSVVFWGGSIFLGLKFIGLQIAALYQNIQLINISEGRDEIAGKHPDKIAIGINVVTDGIKKRSRQTVALANWQNRLFYFGIISFVAWRIWEMYLITPNASN